MPTVYYKNKYGVWVRPIYIGNCQSWNKEKGVWEHGSFNEVPKCCFECRNLDCETGDYGTMLTPYYCTKNVHLPVRKGSCKKQKPYK